MNPYKTKTGIGQKVINGLLIAGVALTLAATITVGVAQKDSIKAAVNGMLGDNEKVAFTNLDKKADLYSDDSHVVVKDGVFTLTNNTAAEIKAIIYSGPKKDGISNLVYTALTFCALDSLDSAIYASSGPGFYIKPAEKINVPVSVSGISKIFPGNTNTFTLYGGASFTYGASPVRLSCPAGASAYVKDLMTVDLAPLGYVNDAKAAGAVWEKLNEGQYFEGDKTFTKGQIKAAIADYDEEQAALKASVAASSAAASSAAA